MSYWTNLNYIFKDGKLVAKDSHQKIKHKHFLENLKDGQEVEIFISVKNKEKSLAQLAKIHACIREISLESGYTFNEVKRYVKEKTGLFNGEDYKSFRDCSVQELTIAIQQCIEMGQEYNINLQ